MQPCRSCACLMYMFLITVAFYLVPTRVLFQSILPNIVKLSCRQLIEFSKTKKLISLTMSSGD